MEWKKAYRVSYDTQALISDASKALADMPKITAPSIRSIKIRLDINNKGVHYAYASDNITYYDALTFSLSDVLVYMQKKTELTCFTIQDILKESCRLKDFF